MKLNHRPIRVAFLDFETQARAPINPVNKYASHPETRVLTCVVKDSCGTVHQMGPYLTDENVATLRMIGDTHTIVAHNVAFDAAIWERTLGLPPAEWMDTMPCARAAGLPGGLDAIGQVLFGHGKDPNGKRLIDMLCILGNRPVPAVNPAHASLLHYNLRDVVLLEQIYERVKGYGEPDVIQLDAVVNERGVPIDRKKLETVLGLYEDNAVKQRLIFDEKTDGINPKSPKQVKEWIQRMGFRLETENGKESIGKSAMAKLLASPDKYYTEEVSDDEEDLAGKYQVLREAMEARGEVVRVGKSKADAALLGLEDDDRIRGLFIYNGAHTGRWTSRGLQLHNMPGQLFDVKTLPMDPESVETKRVHEEHEFTKRGSPRRVSTADVLNCLIRNIVTCDNFLVADYASVEARGLAWVADEQRMLDLYSDPEKNLYLDTGRAVFGREISKKVDTREYVLAKALVLGCGYGMSGPKFEWSCIVNSRVDLSVFKQAGLDANSAVKVYRKTYPRIPAVWKEYGDAVKAAVDGRPSFAGKCYFAMEGPDLHMVLPSGRPMVYRNAKIAQKIPAYCKLYNMPERPVDTVVYDLPRGGEGYLYGSKVCENAVQAICRDLIANAMLNCEQEGLHPVMHVHDEIVCEDLPDKLDRFLEIMTDCPSWAPGFPITAEGYSGPVWTKHPDGYRTCNMILGRKF